MNCPLILKLAFQNLRLSRIIRTPERPHPCLRMILSYHDVITWLSTLKKSLPFQVIEMYEDSNTHSTFQLHSAELHSLDIVVSARRCVPQCHQRKSRLVHYSAHTDSILDALQLLLDVLRRRSFAFGTCGCLRER